MAQCFRDQLRAAGTPGQRVRLWLLTIADLLLNVPARHLDMLHDLDITMRRLRFSTGRKLRFPWASLIHRSPARNTFGRYTETARRALFFAKVRGQPFWIAHYRI